MTAPRIDPELLPGIAAYQAGPGDPTPENIVARRAAGAALLQANPPPIAPTVRVDDRLVPGPVGAPDLRLRCYAPADPSRADAPRPALYWIHGGGMIGGFLESDDPRLSAYVEALDCVVVSVEYRLAPEHPYPAPQDDCWAGLEWTVAHAPELGIDPTRLAVGGMSAGGGLAAATVLRARDRGGPAVAFQYLLCPMLDDRACTPSSTQYDAGVVWGRSSNRVGWTALLGATVGTDVVPYDAAPARLTDFSRLPPTFLDVGEIEVFRDEDLDYARGLLAADVATEFHLYPGAFHGFDVFVPTATVSRRAQEQRIAALRRALRP